MDDEWRKFWKMFHMAWGMNKDGIYNKDMWCEMQLMLEKLKNATYKRVEL